jgi:CheY-like chemotaxis protein/HPt (histidine-containing phosphotransfer) domain-containing protein/two-component sensor histidine kinase
LGITEILLENDNITSDFEEGLEKIFVSCELLLGIINDILDLSKVEAGKMNLVLSEYSLANLINDTTQLNIMRIDNKPIVFEIDIDENLPERFIGDEIRIKQVLNNLLSNAFKYTDAGKVNFSITFEKSTKPKEVILVITVNDTGRGMSNVQLSTLFEAYTRFVDRSKKTVEGTGLGLTITNQLLKLMKGSIIFDSELSVGTLITVRLPQKVVGTEILGAEAVNNLKKLGIYQKTKSKKTKIHRQPMPYGKVLVVDDIEPNLYVARGLMTPYRLQIETVMSGQEAIDRVNEGQEYDVIFMDHMMPYMNGTEATRILREQGYKKPIVVLTANAVTGQKEDFLANGFDDFLSKPIEINLLDAVLVKFIHDRRPPELMIDTGIHGEDDFDDNMLDLDAHHASITMLKNIDGLDVDTALSAMNGMLDVFIDTIKLTMRLLPKSIEKMDTLLSEEKLAEFTVEVHGMKSVMRNIGASILGNDAAQLERSASKEDKSFCKKNYPAFRASLISLSEQLMSVLNDEATEVCEMADVFILKEPLADAKVAVESFDRDMALAALSGVTGFTFGAEIDGLMKEIIFALEAFDCERASEMIDKVLKLTADS